MISVKHMNPSITQEKVKNFIENQERLHFYKNKKHNELTYGSPEGTSPQPHIIFEEAIFCRLFI